MSRRAVIPVAGPGGARRLPPARRQRWLLATAAVMQLAQDGRPRRVLDAGCGDGLFLLDLAQRLPHWQFVGVDVSADALELAEHDRRQRALANVAFAQADILQLPLRDPVDMVLAMECLVEIRRDAEAFRRLADALCDDGLLVAHVPDVAWRPVLRGSAATWRHEVRHGYDATALRGLCDDAGLQLRTLRPTQRNVVTLAQELRDRWKHHPRRLMPFAPALAAAARLDTAGATWGPPRGWLFTAGRAPAAVSDGLGGPTRDASAPRPEPAPAEPSAPSTRTTPGRPSP